MAQLGLGPAKKADVVHLDDADRHVVRLTMVTATGLRVTADLPPDEAERIGDRLIKAASTVAGRQP